MTRLQNCPVHWVTLVLVIGLVVVLIGCGWAALVASSSEPFAAPTKTQPPPTYKKGARVFVRQGQRFCFWKGTIAQMPSKSSPSDQSQPQYIHIQYDSPTPSGGPYTEQWDTRHAHGFPENDAPRDRCHVFLDTEENAQYISQEKNDSALQGADLAQQQLYCNPQAYTSTAESAQQQVLNRKQTTFSRSGKPPITTKDIKKKALTPSVPAPAPVAPAPRPAAPPQTTSANKCNACAWTFTAVPFQPGTQPKKSVEEKVTISPLSGSGGGGGAVPMGVSESDQAAAAPQSALSALSSGSSMDALTSKFNAQSLSQETGGKLPMNKKGFDADFSSLGNKFKTGIHKGTQSVEKTKAYRQVNKSKAVQSARKQSKALQAKASAQGKAEATAQKAKKNAAETAQKAKQKVSAETAKVKNTFTSEFFANPTSTIEAFTTSDSSSIADTPYYFVLYYLMHDLWANTYLDVEINPENPLNASPSITSDTYHQTDPQEAAQFANDYMYYNTPNGCVPPDNAHTSPQSTQLKTYPSACSATMYRFRIPTRTEVHMVGSDDGGSALLMCPQLAYQLTNDIRQATGQSPGSLSVFQTMASMCIFNHIPMRKYATVHALKTQLNPEYTYASKNVHTESGFVQLMTRIQKQIEHLNQTLHAKHPGFTYPTSDNTVLYKQPQNYMVPIVAARITNSTSHSSSEPTDATAGSPTTMCCESDKVISVGYGNDDVAAAIAVASYQNASLCRLMIGGEMQYTESEMLGRCFGERTRLNLEMRDRVVLRLLVFVFMGALTNTVMSTLGKSNTPTQATGSTWMANTVLQLIQQTAVQKISLCSTVSPATVATHPLMKEWCGMKTLASDPKRVTLARQIIDALLPVNTPTPERSPLEVTDTTPVHKAVASKTVLIPKFTGTVYTTNVSLPWVTGVFGVHAAVDPSLTSHFNVMAELVDREPTRAECRLILQRVGTPTAQASINKPFYVYLTKRLTVERVPADTYMQRIVVGYHASHELSTIHQLLPHPAVYAIPDNAIQNSSPTYINGRIYKSGLNEQCYQVQCTPFTNSRGQRITECCKGVSDISECGQYAQRIECPKGIAVNQLTANDALCHGTEYNTAQCHDTFHQLLSNARNATLIIDEEAMPGFISYVTESGANGVRLNMLAKVVKSIILTTSAFNDIAVNMKQMSVQEMNDTSSASYKALVQWWKTLDFLYTCYEVVALVAPPAMSNGGELMSNVDNLQTTAERVLKFPCRKCPPPPKSSSSTSSTSFACTTPTFSHYTTNGIAFQAHKTLTMTFRRKLDNSSSWRALPATSLLDLQRIHNFVQREQQQIDATLDSITKPHHSSARMGYSTNIMRTILSYSCPPAMTETIMGLKWYGQSLVGIEYDSSQPDTLNVLERCSIANKQNNQ